MYFKGQISDLFFISDDGESQFLKFSSFPISLKVMPRYLQKMFTLRQGWYMQGNGLPCL